MNVHQRGDKALCAAWRVAEDARDVGRDADGWKVAGMKSSQRTFIGLIAGFFQEPINCSRNKLLESHFFR